MANTGDRTRHFSYDLESRNPGIPTLTDNAGNNISMLRITEWLDNHQESFGTVRKNPKFKRYRQNSVELGK